MKPLEARMVTLISKKLGCRVEFVKWQRSPNGDVPIFRVPPSHVARAKALWLTVEEVV